jgi:hypothetical protein
MRVFYHPFIIREIGDKNQPREHQEFGTQIFCSENSFFKTKVRPNNEK